MSPLLSHLQMIIYKRKAGIFIENSSGFRASIMGGVEIEFSVHERTFLC